MGMMHFVGVGPGDPELLTLKAVRLITEADCIAVADSGNGKSVALTIVDAFVEAKPILRLHIPMKGTAESWRYAHEEAARLLAKQLDAGRKVVYPVLGDPSIYASSGYLLRLLQGNYPCTVIPGIPSFCEAAARQQVVLCEDREPLHILAGYEPGDEIPKGNVVIMKAGRHLASIQEALRGREAYLVQNLGLAGEFLMRIEDANIHSAERQSYFSIVLVK